MCKDPKLSNVTITESRRREETPASAGGGTVCTTEEEVYKAGPGRGQPGGGRGPGPPAPQRPRARGLPDAWALTTAAAAGGRPGGVVFLGEQFAECSPVTKGPENKQRSRFFCCFFFFFFFVLFCFFFFSVQLASLSEAETHSPRPEKPPRPASLSTTGRERGTPRAGDRCTAGSVSGPWPPAWLPQHLSPRPPPPTLFNARRQESRR